MTSEEYIKLYEKFIAGSITQEEERVLLEYRDKFKWQDADEFMPDEDHIKNRIFEKITSGASARPVKVTRLRMWWLAAAVVLLTLTTGVIFFVSNHQPVQQNTVNDRLASNRINKSKNNAVVLTLANGSVIKLDHASNGVLSVSGKTLIKKLNNGQLVYDQTNGPDNAIAQNNNSLTIPRGGQYQVTLVDGTKVWLNAESTLIYPTNFTGSERNVELKGEAYFEVAKNAKMPFKVKTNGAEIVVLGTHFNINAYPKDLVKTTLLEGSVKLSNGPSSVLLTPGQQGVTGKGTSKILVKTVRLNDEIAWKNGYFVFHDDNIQEIMAQISRWYDVDVEYQGNVTNKGFGGIYSKTKDIAELLSGLELTGLVHFKTEGRRVIVMQ